MSLLAKCPKCGCMIAKGTTCPNCFHGENAQAPEQLSSVEEYERRQGVHKRNYSIFMVATLCLGLTTILLILSIIMVTRGRRVAGAVAPRKPPSITMENAGDPGASDPDDAGLDPDLMPEDPDLPPLNPDDFDYSPLYFWFAIILGLTLTEGGLTYFVLKCRNWWPIELLCPGCNERLDELGGDPERCPSCMARLR